MMTLEEIRSEIEKYCHADIMAKSQKSNVIEARRMFCYMAKKEGYRLTEIGKHINIKHSTVLHHIKKIEVFLVMDKRVIQDVEAINKLIKNYNRREYVMIRREDYEKLKNLIDRI